MKSLLLTALIGLYITPVANAQENQEGFKRRGPPPNFEEIKKRIDAACATDIATYCAELEGHDVMKCLHKNKTSISDECRAAFPPKPPRHHGFDKKDSAANQ